MDFLSQRIKNMEESATLAMTRKSRELKAKGLDIINLSIGEPDFNTPEFIKEAAKKAIDENYTHYPPVPGYPELREAIVVKLRRDNGLDYKPSQIVVSTGAKQALANCVLSVVNPGDEVLIPAPYWVSYAEIVKLAEGKPIFLYAGIEQDFKITPRQLEEAITPSTRLIMFNSPSNPTGSVYTPAEMEALAQVLLKYPHVFILSDEIYEYIIFEGKHTSFASFDGLYDRVAVVNGVSKGYAMTGWRLGYLAGPQAIADACNKIQGQMTSGTCSIAQRAAIDAMLRNPAETQELQEMVKAFRTRRDLLLHLMQDIPGLKCNKPEGAFYLFPNVTYFYGKKNGDCLIQNGDDLCLYLLDRAQVALVPGSAFGDPSCIRISYATSEEQLTEAMRRIKVALSELS
ncbi:MAG: pyridoxal phosphate-dependent aminotransferase [Bacteroidales bacterium]|jgi:aspartate aminotransferase|nr:pyridoxal phosphate-dependent aminotransferase [Bacteroidales bacterium]NPV37442.1 pyridoxal phosphate-dependent aminotransferase [Bacteroidales bacterium]